MTIACASTPTGMCAFPPISTSATVVGTLANAQGAPLPDTPIILSATPSVVDGKWGAFVHGVRTNNAGSFATILYSFAGEPTQTVYALVVRAPGDTVLVSSTRERFGQSWPPDTVRLTLRLP